MKLDQEHCRREIQDHDHRGDLGLKKAKRRDLSRGGGSVGIATTMMTRGLNPELAVH